ncbi:glutamate receptor ionotropic, kainate glr-3-like isoform X1 [Biomphalaria glabrata]|uniref:Glutamate receptor ionotropic, kainate glr-3-like isoform X1 n=1 Tax=Biomphalaria glabrata TaxID=6526 RepID=A0A9W2ZVH6_BIOGL|nr:glutamate receptor ionotropic, kainate glr-3-like isoform X1 [Biomphalaria glabrata]KAI8740608.1 Glutamate receptor ionotropic; kainate 2 [Biomphalaria glabrata]
MYLKTSTGSSLVLQDVRQINCVSRDQWFHVNKCFPPSQQDNIPQWSMLNIEQGYNDNSEWLLVHDSCFRRAYNDSYFGGENLIDYPNGFRVLYASLQGLNWTRVIIVYEARFDPYIDAISSSRQILVTLFRIGDKGLNTTSSHQGEEPNVPTWRSSLTIGLIVDSLYQLVKQESKLNILVICSDECLGHVLMEANKEDQAQEASKELQMRSRWLLFMTSSNDIERVTSVVLNVTRVDSVALLQSLNDNLTYFYSLPESAMAKITSLYYGNGSRYLADVAIVTSHLDIVQLGEDTVFPNVKFHLNQRLLKVVIAEWPPFIIKDKTGSYSGFCMDILRYLETRLNFTSILVDSTSQGWGREVNGSFSGMIGQLQQKQVDIMMAPVTIDAERAHVMDFTFPFFIDYTTVVLKKADPYDTKWLTLIEPFTWQVHVTIFISLLCFTALVTLLERLNPYYKYRQCPSPFRGYIDCLWYTYGALINQGGEYLPKSLTARTLLSCWWLFTLVISSTYSGNLFAFLTVSKETPPFDTLRAMLEHKDFKWGLVGETILERLFMNSNDSIQRAVWEKVQQFNQSDSTVLSLDMNDHLSKVQRGHYAYISDKSVADFLVDKQCNLVKIKENFFRVQYAIGLVNQSAYTQLFSAEILLLSEFGLLNIWIKKWWPEQSVCKGQIVTEAAAISILDIQSVFYLLLVGICISGCVLCFEHWMTLHCNSIAEILFVNDNQNKAT